MKGHAPVTHHLSTDSATDDSTLSFQSRPPTVNQLPLSLLVNVNFRQGEDVPTLSEVCSNCQWVEIRLKGMSFQLNRDSTDKVLKDSNETSATAFRVC